MEHRRLQIDTPSTLVGLLRDRASCMPATQAFSFLDDQGNTAATMTYEELDLRAREIAALLQECGAAGERALLLYPPGLDYIAAFFGCLYAEVVAVPVYPPNPARLDRTLPRLQAIVEDARPALALTIEAIVPMATLFTGQAPGFQTLRWYATDGLASSLAERWEPPVLGGETLAFLQYTSGSTALPRGVILTHANLLENTRMIYEGLDGASNDLSAAIWLPPYHDMGLIGGIIEPIYAGTPVMLMSPASFLQRPRIWLEAITRMGAGGTCAPNFAYDLCVRKIAPEQRAGLDLSSLQVALCGAEPIRPETLRRFADAFAPCGFRWEAFYPCYGLAEATLIVSGGQAAAAPVTRSYQRGAIKHRRAVAVADNAPDAQELVGCGQALGRQQLLIVDAATGEICQPGQIGEIWVAGPSIAQGYWNRPEESAQTFRARPAGADSGAFLRTGDLGFLDAGELFVTGRIKDVIIIHGRNYYPQDLELAVGASSPALRAGGGAAFSVEVEGVERLVIMHEVERQHRKGDLDGVIAEIRRVVAEEFELAVYAVVLIEAGSMPKTSSGKLQRYMCRAGFLEGSIRSLAAWQQVFEPGESAAAQLPAPPEQLTLGDLQTWLVAQVAQMINVDPRQVVLGEPLGAQGLDSVMALELRSRIEEALGLRVSATAAWNYPTIAALAEHLAEQLGAGAAGRKAPAHDQPTFSADESAALAQALQDMIKTSEERGA